MAVITISDLAGRQLVPLGAAFLNLSNPATFCPLFIAGNIVQPSGAGKIVVAYVTYEWDPNGPHPPNNTHVSTIPGTSQNDLNDLPVGGGAFAMVQGGTLNDQVAILPKGTLFGVDHDSGPANIITKVTAWGWSA